MDTSTVTVRADTLGRRVVPRQFRSLEDKLQIIAEARAPGASVAAIARKHGVNANLVFVWMRQQEHGVLSARTRQSRPKLLAVTVSPAATIDEPRRDPAPRPLSPTAHLEITLPDGTCVRAFGAVPTGRLERVLRLLRR
jgi:transposase-like protein